jgi:hypothetical protein
MSQWNPAVTRKAAGMAKPNITNGDYERLAEFRYLLRLLRRFLIFSQKAAVEAGLTAQHAADFLPLRAISLGMLWISVAAWTATVIGLASSSWRSFREFRRSVARHTATH